MHSIMFLPYILFYLFCKLFNNCLKIPNYTKFKSNLNYDLKFKFQSVIVVVLTSRNGGSPITMGMVASDMSKCKLGYNDQCMTCSAMEVGGGRRRGAQVRQGRVMLLRRKAMK